MSIGCVVNFYREPHALPNFLKHAPAMFDEVVLVSSPPDGKTDEETIDIAIRSGHRLFHDTVSHGFGALRTRCLSYSKCDWVFILDCDEVVWATAPRMTPVGNDTWPSVKQPNNSVIVEGNIDQKAAMQRAIRRTEQAGKAALCVHRRHWMDAPGEWQRPAQNWRQIQDPQLRCVRNDPFIGYDPMVRMHEKLVDFRTFGEPPYESEAELFIDHYAIHFRAMEPEQNAEDIAIYESLDPGCTDNMWIKHQPRA